MTRKPVLRGRARSNFARVPDEIVEKGKEMLSEGSTAARVVRQLNVSYPTVLKWKKALAKMGAAFPTMGAAISAAEVAPTVSSVLEESSSVPARRADPSFEEFIRALRTLMEKDCTLSMSKDRDRYVAWVTDRDNHRVTTQNATTELAVVDALGKWKREYNGHSR